MSDLGITAPYDSARWLRRIVAAEPSLLEAQDGVGLTPLLLASAEGYELCVGTLLGLGANVGAVYADSKTALACACHSASLSVVRQLIAAGAASAALLPPGSPQARNVAYFAATAALLADQGCGKCAVRCGGDHPGDCADGLDILHAVLAAGVREAVRVDGRSLPFAAIVQSMHAAKATRATPAHVLTVLQALHAAGVDVLTRGPADEMPVLHAAVSADQPTWVRWLGKAAGKPLEEQGPLACTALLLACSRGSLAVAHVLLDCGARVDVQSAHETRMWPVMVAAQLVDRDDGALLKRMLAAGRDSMLRRTAARCFTASSFNLHRR
jgi:hypothetical protein